MKAYRKLFAALAGAGVMFGKAISDGHVSSGEVGEIVITLCVALGVWAAPNDA